MSEPPYILRMAIVRVLLAVLAAVVTMVAVFAIKRGTEWGLSGLPSQAVIDLALVVAVPLYVWGAWTYLLRPRLKLRQERQDAGLRQRAIRDRAGD